MVGIIEVDMKPEEHSTLSDQPKAPSKLRRFLYGLVWLIIFPVIVAVPSFVILLMILSAVLTSLGKNHEFNGAIADNGVFYLELYLFIFVTVLVIVLLLVRWLLRTRKRYFFRTGAKVLGMYIWIGIFATGLTMALITRNPDAIKPQVEQDTHIMQVISTIGGDTARLRDVSVQYVPDYKNGFKDQAGEYMSYDDSKGNFSYGTLTVMRGLASEEEKIVVAHEYLHHVWETELDVQTIHDLTSQLMTLYGQDDWFKTRVANYSDTNMLMPTELFAYYCTESSDGYLTPYVLEQCSKYINRKSLRLAR